MELPMEMKMEMPMPLPMSLSVNLDEHLAELDEPDADLLQDCLLEATPTPSATTYTDTPTPLSTGYTSEESSAPPLNPTGAASLPPSLSEEQLYGDMTFLQRSNTRELEEEVADLCGGDDLTQLSPHQQQVFGGKMIKGKTSRYRGVTQTSKTSWGAKYSAKRITNTCKTPEDAAHAYDAYIRTNCPEKYPKFANFCMRCGHFVNPLSLPQFKNECSCDGASDNGSTEAESPLPRSETDGEEDGEELPLPLPDAPPGELRISNLSLNSLKLSLLEEEGNPLMDESMLQIGNLMNGTTDNYVKREDSLTMAVEALGGMVGELERDGQTTLTPKAYFPHSDRNSFGPIPTDMTTMPMAAMTDVNPEGLPQLPAFFDMMHTGQMLDANAVAAQQPDAAFGNVHSVDFHPEVDYHKNHSLDFEEQQFGAMGKTHSLDFDRGDSMQYGYATSMELDELVSTIMPYPTTSVPGDNSTLRGEETQAASSYSTSIEIVTPFLKTYWRNDRKNIQCFPMCPEHGDYERVRMEGLHHQCKGVCRAPVNIRVVIPSSLPIAPADMIFLARCNCTFSRNETFGAYQQLNSMQITKLQNVSASGSVGRCDMLPSGDGYQLEVSFYPDVWKFEFDLPKKRRHGDGSDQDGWNSDYSYFFEVDVFHSSDNTIYQRLGRTESAQKFRIGNTRTLLRQLAKMNDEADPDRVNSAHTKKMKITYATNQTNRESSLITDDMDPEIDVMKLLDEKRSIAEESDTSSEASQRIESKEEDNGPIGTVYKNFASPKTVGQPAVLSNPNVSSHPDASAIHSPAALFGYSIFCIPMSLVVACISWILLVSFLLVPSPVVRLLDALSDSDLRRANSSIIASDRRYVLNRLEVDASKKPNYRGNGAVWGRFAYFGGGKPIISIVVFVPALVFVLFGVILFPIRPVSKQCFKVANSCVLVSREYTRKTTGKPLNDAMV